MSKLHQQLHLVNAGISIAGLIYSLYLGDQLFALNYFILVNSSLAGFVAASNRSTGAR